LIDFQQEWALVRGEVRLNSLIVRFNEQFFYIWNGRLMSTRRSKKATAATDSDPSPALGKTIQRLRKAYNMSLGELSEQSGVAKSIISQIERNETNPTLSTVYRLSRALDTTIEEVLREDSGQVFLEHQSKSGVPMLESQDGLCRLAITGPLNLVDSIQWYDFQARPNGVLESDPHPPGTVEHLYVVRGTLEVTSGEFTEVAKTGETLRFRGDLPHKIVNIGGDDAHASMVLVLRQLGAGEAARTA
jgi:transcriptional regulator with XRE-family HTH domain